MRSKNNITPKSSSPFVMAGSNNIIDANLKEAIILGDGNIVGDSKNVALIGSSGNIIGSGCENITMISSSGNTINPGLTNVTLHNTYGLTVTESDKTYRGGAEERGAQSGEVLANIYEIKVDVSSADILQLFTVPFQLLPAPPTGFFTDVISAQAKVNTVTTGYAFANDIVIKGTGVSRMITFDNILLFPFAVPAYLLHSGVKETNTNSQYLVNGALYLFAETSNPVGGDYTMTIYLTYKYTEL